MKINNLLYHREELKHHLVIDMAFIYSSYQQLIDFYISKHYPHVDIEKESLKEYERRKKIDEERRKKFEEENYKEY